jgi:protein-tyrosine phosphatase
LPDNSLRIKWKVDAKQVTVSSLTDPDQTTSGKLIKTISNHNELVLPGFDPKTRVYFKLEFTGGRRDGESLIVAERFIRLDSVNNLRDIGGYKTMEGRKVRWGRVFRSGNFSHLTKEDMETLNQLKVKSIFDLRSTEGANKNPDKIPPNIEYYHSPVYEKEFEKELYPALLFQRHKLGEILGSGYWHWPQNGASAYGQLFNQIADPKSLPLIFHCTAGKDRAGIAVAILYALLGVPDETIIADYSLTNQEFNRLYQEFLESERGHRLGIPPSDIKIMIAANPDWIKRTLTLLHTKYNGAEDYLKQTTGVSQDAINAIRRNLLYE